MPRFPFLVVPGIALVLALAVPSSTPALANVAEPAFDYTCNTLPLDPSPGVVRVSGADRYQTAIAVSRLRYGNGQGCEVSIASGRDFPDAITAAAHQKWGPLLLVQGTSLSTAVRREITRLDPVWFNTYGGTGAISPGIMSQLSRITDGRIVANAGATRYETAAKATMEKSPGAPVFIATGGDYPDALTAAGLIGRSQGSFLLVGVNSIPRETQIALRTLRPSRIVALGGAGAVSPQVERALRDFTRGSVTRISGATRYETAVQVSQRLAPDGDWAVTIVSGRSFADALSAAPLRAGPVLLVEPDSIPDVVRDELRRLEPQKIYIVGGTAAVSAAVQAELEQYLRPID